MDITIILTIFCIVFLVVGIVATNSYIKTSKELTKLKHQYSTDKQIQLQNDELITDLRNSLESEREKNKKIASQKKSSETRIGLISEQLLPILTDCPYEPKNMSFLGKPIDYLVFDLDQGEIVFLEVKSGNSRASKRQKTIKNIIKEGKVYYEEMRINQKGITVKRDE